jgi:hypothetical protein
MPNATGLPAMLSPKPGGTRLGAMRTNTRTWRPAARAKRASCSASSTDSSTTSPAFGAELPARASKPRRSTASSSSPSLLPGPVKLSCSPRKPAASALSSSPPDETSSRSQRPRRLARSPGAGFAFTAYEIAKRPANASRSAAMRANTSSRK